MAKRRRRRKSRRRSLRSVAEFSGFEGLGSEFLAEIGGIIAHCKRYGVGKSGKIRCVQFAPGGGMPSMRNRRKAGVKRSWRETSHLRRRKARRPHFKGATRRCLRRKKNAAGKWYCASFAPVARGKFKYPKKSRVCIRKATGKDGKMHCVKYRVSRKGKKGKKRKYKKSANGRRKSQSAPWLTPSERFAMKKYGLTPGQIRT